MYVYVYVYVYVYMYMYMYMYMYVYVYVYVYVYLCMHACMHVHIMLTSAQRNRKTTLKADLCVCAYIPKDYVLACNSTCMDAWMLE